MLIGIMTYFPQAEEERRRQEELQRIEEEEMKKNKTKSKFKKAMSTIKKSRQQERSNKSSPTKVRNNCRRYTCMFTCMGARAASCMYFLTTRSLYIIYQLWSILSTLMRHTSKSRYLCKSYNVIQCISLMAADTCTHTCTLCFRRLPRSIEWCPACRASPKR